jgi:hypothetical protein
MYVYMCSGSPTPTKGVPSSAREPHEQQFIYCNSCVQCAFLDDGNDGEGDINSSCGIITENLMYYHTFCSFLEPKVVVVGEWYTPTGFDNSGLLQVRYNPNFKSENVAFLFQCAPTNLVLWPKEPFTFGWKWPEDYKNQDTDFSVINR